MKTEVVVRKGGAMVLLWVDIIILCRLDSTIFISNNLQMLAGAVIHQSL